MDHKGQAVPWLEEAWEGIVNKTLRNAKRLGSEFPHSTSQGVYNKVPPYHWVAGFWPGVLWQVHRETGDAELKELAVACERRIAGMLAEHERLHHDVGFMFSLSSVAQYKLTGDEEAKRNALLAAQLLAGRFNPVGSFLRAWPDWDGEDHSGWAIIDCMMNLSLLYWASGKLRDPRYRHIANLHADTVIRTFFRADGSVHHIVCFDPETGQKLGSRGGQGYDADSAWSRGVSWAIYGFSLCCRYSGEVRYVQAAQAAADFFLSNMPEDGVPPWDFRAPPELVMYKDSSAAACAASGLLELAELTPGARGQSYRTAAVRLLSALCSSCASWGDDAEEGLLLHGTGYLPARDNIDVSLIYGDYFFVEAICKLRGPRELFW